MVPPASVKTSVRANDALALLHGRRYGPLAHHLMRVAEILHQDAPASLASTDRFEAAWKKTRRGKRSDEGIETRLPAVRDGDPAVGAAGFEKQATCGGSAPEIEAQVSNGRNQGLSCALDGDARDLIV